MYTPAAFAEDRPQWIANFLVEHPMAQLVTMTDGGLVATPLPLLYEQTGDDMGSLVGHVARPNRQWAQATPGIEALAIFTGANTYVSPGWYPSKREHGKVVPTWNYETVHVRGELIVHDDLEWKLALVTRLTQRHESGLKEPWSPSDAPSEYITAMLRAIVGLEVRVRSIEAKRKLSQNRTAADSAAVIAALSERAGSPAEVADAMRSL